MTGRQVIVPDWWKLSAPEAAVLRWVHLEGVPEHAPGEGLSAAELSGHVPRGVDVRSVIRKLERRHLLCRQPRDKARWVCTSQGRFWLYGLQYGFEVAQDVKAQVEALNACLGDPEIRLEAADRWHAMAPARGEATFPPAPAARFERRGVPTWLAAVLCIGCGLGLLLLMIPTSVVDLVAHAVRGGRP